MESGVKVAAQFILISAMSNHASSRHVTKHSTTSRHQAEFETNRRWLSYYPASALAGSRLLTAAYTVTNGEEFRCPGFY